jgi:pimeloyl-ACP methyl ester carboxylesterase
MKERVHLSEWRSAEAEQRFRAMEDELVRDLVADPPTAVDVPTRLGPTRAYQWEGTGVPVVFLHGTAGTSLMWAPYAERRAGRAMYAVDTIGDVGRSQQQVAVETAGDLADWLAETLSGLGLDRAHLAGTSYGGFLALNLAVRRPDLVRSLFLIDPAGIERVRMLRFMLWGTSALFASRLPGRLRMRAARRLRMPVLEDARVMRLGLYGQLNHRSRLLPPGPLTDDQLRSIEQPVVLALGEKSEVFPSTDVRARAGTLLRQVTVEVVEGAGHGVSLSHVEVVAGWLAAFLEVGSISRSASGNCS